MQIKSLGVSWSSFMLIGAKLGPRGIHVNRQTVFLFFYYIDLCFVSGHLECPCVPHQDSIDIMTIMEEALSQMGVKY